MFLRLFIINDPQAQDRGFSLAGIKVPMPAFCPVDGTPEMQALDGSKVFLRTEYKQFWLVPVEFLVKARPSLARHLHGVDNLYIPVDWCDVAPVDSVDQVWSPPR